MGTYKIDSPFDFLLEIVKHSLKASSTKFRAFPALTSVLFVSKRFSIVAMANSHMTQTGEVVDDRLLGSLRFSSFIFVRNSPKVIPFRVSSTSVPRIHKHNHKRKVESYT